MITPNQSTVKTTKAGQDFIVYSATHFDCTNVNNAFLVPATGWDIVSFQVCGTGGTALSTGVLSLIASNDPDGNEWAVHPTSTTLSAPGVTLAAEVEHLYVGVGVTTAQAVLVDIHLCLRRA